MATKSQTTTTLATERAAKALATASESLVKTSATVQASLEKTVATALTSLSAEVIASTEKLQTLSEAVEDKTAELAGLEASFKQREDEAAYNLRIAVRDDADGVLAGLLRERSLAHITSEALAKLTRERDSLEDAREEAIENAVSEAVDRERQSSKAVLERTVSDHKVEIAEFVANAKSKDATITLLREQLDQAREDLAAERKARVETEQYRSQASGVTINH